MNKEHCNITGTGMDLLQKYGIAQIEVKVFATIRTDLLVSMFLSWGSHPLMEALFMEEVTTRSVNKLTTGFSSANAASVTFWRWSLFHFPGTSPLLWWLLLFEVRVWRHTPPLCRRRRSRRWRLRAVAVGGACPDRAPIEVEVAFIPASSRR